MLSRQKLALFCLAMLGVTGCRVDDASARRRLAEEKKQAATARVYVPHPQTLSLANDAQRVVDSCGSPISDVVEVIHDKLHNGPTRLMTYRGRQLVTVEFIPYVTLSNGTLLPWSGDRDTALRDGTIWRFQAAHIQNREFLTSKHLTIYLPCAARALADEL